MKDLNGLNRKQILLISLTGLLFVAAAVGSDIMLKAMAPSEPKAVEMAMTATGSSAVYSDISSRLTDEVEEIPYEPGPTVLNLAYYYPEGADTEDVINSYAGQIYSELAGDEAAYLSEYYELYDMTPLELAASLGLGRDRVMGKYDPTEALHSVSDPSTWTVNRFKNVSVAFYDGDGNRINEYSAVKEIISMASVYSYYHDMMDADSMAEYARSLWEHSHDSSISLGSVYYCSGCLNRTAQEEAQEALAQEAQQQALREALAQATAKSAGDAALAALGIGTGAASETQETAGQISSAAESMAPSTQAFGDGSSEAPTSELETTSASSAASQAQDTTAPSETQTEGTASTGSFDQGSTAVAESQTIIQQTETSAALETEPQTTLPTDQAQTEAQLTGASPEASEAGEQQTNVSTEQAQTEGQQGVAAALQTGVQTTASSEAASAGAQDAAIADAAAAYTAESSSEANAQALTDMAAAAAIQAMAETQTASSSSAPSEGSGSEASSALSEQATETAVETAVTQAETSQGGLSEASDTIVGNIINSLGGGVAQGTQETSATQVSTTAQGGSAVGEGAGAPAVTPSANGSAASNEALDTSYCPGHIDVYVTIRLKGIDDINGLIEADSIGNDPANFNDSWQGWTEERIEEAKELNAQDWFSRYGLTISAINVGTPLSTEQISYYMSLLGDDVSKERRDILEFALNSVGKVPYYWGGKPYGAGYERNHFGTLTFPDTKGRVLRGLDCSGWINWVYWSVRGYSLPGESTGTLVGCGSKISRSQLRPGDIIIRTGADAHVVMFLAWAENGNMIVVHETGGVINNVIVSEMTADWPYYRTLIYD